MYTTDYDLIVAREKSRAFREEMKMLRMAQVAEAEKAGQPGLLARLVAMTSRVAHLPMPGREGAAA
jgi:hypothetical protein